jgi:tungstate transport system permease protein
VQDQPSAFVTAARLIAGLDHQLLEIVGLSLKVSLTAVALAALIGLPLGAILAIARFRGRRLVVVAINTLMALPSVVVGLLVYMVLSNSGPLGVLQLLYTPSAMILA